MNNLFKKIFNKLKNKFSLSDNGERVDINNNKNTNFEKLDMYQKNHIKRYEFAKQLLNPGDIVGDFACGTGYGTAMLSEKSVKVIGMDINKKVIETIKKRYQENKRVEFITSNILDIKYENYFNKIVSFETIEHLEENDIPKVFNLFFKALKDNGKLTFSVPYMQKNNKAAAQMGFHKTFYIDENKIQTWLDQAGFKKSFFKYQNY